MTAIHINTEVNRATRMNASLFEAWKLVSGTHHPLRIDATTLENVKAEAQTFCHHKEQFVILERRDGKQIVRVYQIKQGREIYVRSPSTGSLVKSREMKADLVSEMHVAAYQPELAWSWSRGADVVGVRGEVFCG